jgi:hypothetical protein
MSKNKDLHIEMVGIEEISPYAGNAKIHTEGQIEALAAVIKKQGWDVPIVVDRNGVIIKGHGRRLAAIHLGLKKVPVIRRTDLSEEQVKAARLSDNQVAQGEFDTELLRDELRALADTGFDVSDIGFGEKELSMFLDDIDTFNEDAFLDSAGASGAAAVDKAEKEVQATLDSLDGVKTPTAATGKQPTVAELLGFKFVPEAHERAVAQFQACAEQLTGKTLGEAFGEFCAQLVPELRSRM